MKTIQELIQDHIVNGKGEKVAWETISGSGKYLGLYFSAHWCPPCRSFTPKLDEYYTKMKDSGKNFEIVFISSDRDEAAFKEYFGEMSWLSLRFSEREIKAEVSKKYDVRGIPMLIIIDGATGEIITKKGRERVMGDPDGFPWLPKTFSDILYSGKLKSKDGSEVEASSVKDKVKALYFSAHWCPPCRGFTPQLVKTYNKLKEQGKDFEIIFASSDQNEEAFDEYFGEMPWLALPFGDNRKSDLSELCEVEGIPTLAIFGADDKLITSDGRGSVAADPDGTNFPWYPKPLNELTDDTASSLNEKPSLVYFTGGEEAEVSKAKELLTPIAEKEFSKDTPSLLFFYTDEADDMVDSLKSFTKLKCQDPFVAVINIPSQEVCELEGDEITADKLEQLVASFIAGNAKMRSF